MASYTITKNITNVSSDTVFLTIKADGGYKLPETIEVLNGTLEYWYPETGDLAISNITAETTINIVAEEKTMEYFSIKVDYTDVNAGTENEVSNVYIGLCAYSGNAPQAGEQVFDGELDWSNDLVTWNTIGFSGHTVGEKLIPVTNGETIYFRGKGNTFIGNNSYGSSYKTFRMLVPNGHRSDISIDKLTVSGDILTLLDYENPPTSYSGATFAEMFNDMRNTSGISSELDKIYASVNEIDASNLILPDFTFYSCYGMMFRNNNIVHMPKLPALEVAQQAYRAMFSGTSEVRNVSALPATKVGDSGYYSMFNNNALDKLPEIAATELNYEAYGFMFTGVPRNGISTEPQEGLVPWYLSGSPVTLTSGNINSSMFNYSDLNHAVNVGLNGGGPAVLYVDPNIYTVAKLEDL